jgi:hypothetical protein
MVETRRSDEPLVETVEPEALARRARAERTSGGEVPARGARKAVARSPERMVREPSMFERTLGTNEWSFWVLMAVRTPHRAQNHDALFC